MPNGFKTSLKNYLCLLEWLEQEKKQKNMSVKEKNDQIHIFGGSEVY